jgi:fatty acid desaturase
MVDGKPRRLWRNSPADAILLGICIAQLAGTIALAAPTQDGLWPRLGSAILVTAMMTYSLIVVSHLFVHQPWFTDDRLNAVVSMVSRRAAVPAGQGGRRPRRPTLPRGGRCVGGVHRS